VTLASAEIDVWILEVPEEGPTILDERRAALLSPDERARLRRFHREPDRRLYLFAHALVRTTLSLYAPDLPPAQWRFVSNAHGRPEIAPGLVDQPLRFNLSHTRGLVACAVALERDVGVDVEHLEPPNLDLGLAASHFAPAEAQALATRPAAAQRARFFALWTLKEAYIKARGLGLAMPLDQFAFDLDGSEIGVRFSPEANDDEHAWHFARLAPTPRHALALAARRAPGEPLIVNLRSAPG
jgi:4'-phosphopantetheinyl transferase